MEYELRTLENMISDVLQPGKQRQTKLTIEFIRNFRSKFKTESERIKQQLAKEVIDFRNTTQELKQYVYEHQYAIVVMIDQLNSYATTNGPLVKVPSNKKALVDLLKEVLAGLESIYHFIRLSCNQYFDVDAIIPAGIKIKVHSELSKLLKETEQNLNSLEIELQLRNIISDPFQKILKEGKENYRDLYYLRELNSALKNEINSDSIASELLQLNFNSSRFFNYYIQRIKIAEDSEKSTGDLIIFYTYHIKIINQTSIKNNLQLNPKMPSIRDQLVSWMAEEVYYLEKKHSIINHSPDLDVPNKGPEYKVQTSLSVSHLSLAVKLLLDAGIIQNKNVTELLKNVAKNFRTEKSETISEGSLRNKSYNYEARTVNEMKDVIIGLLNQVRKY